VLFDQHTRALVYGAQILAVQRMLDFDFLCRRSQPSVAAIVAPDENEGLHKCYWGDREILIPIVSSISHALERAPDIDVMVNFASLRSATSSTLEALQYPQIRTIAIIAEGIPERRARMLAAEALRRGVTIIGPATVGGIKPGCFRIGNTGGALDNIIESRLYRPGSVAYVSRSGGLSNELNNIIARNSNGVYEGIAIGGDLYPGTSFLDHMLRFEADPSVHMIVLLGEVGGGEEYVVAEALASRQISKPVIAWCTGSCAEFFHTDVQFGHAGALARGQQELASAKNAALRAAGALVPESFDTFGDLIKHTYTDLVQRGVILEQPEPEPPRMPMDYDWARKLGLVRRSSNFVSTICDDRGEELKYANMPISQVLADEMGLGGVIGLLWFKRQLPEYARRFIEMALILVADHGPAVSGAHNTIVTARAGKDLISSLTAGLLTIGPRFGGAIDGAARQLTWAYDSGMSPEAFVQELKRRGERIMGIGHRIKSIHNPDQRVTLLRNFAQQHFVETPILTYALAIEQLTSAKRSNLILNVDGCLAACFVDLMRSSGCFQREEADQYVELGCLNGLFVLGRTVGLIGHYLDQQRLGQGLYRHPWDDIAYMLPE
jgi:ATP citrate (pro-S)-lyase